MKNKKIYVAGHRGMVGSALVRQLQDQGYKNLILKSRDELNLSDTDAVNSFFKTEKPQWVFLAAAKVGGILGNSRYPVEFLLDNLKIQNNVIEAAYQNGAEKLMFLGSSCIYPRECPQPIKEDYLLTSALEATNEPYALAKIAGIKLCEAYNKQYDCNFLSVMPTNLYGENDNYHPENAHVLPMLLARFHHAAVDQQSEVVVWGTGTVRREFLFADDLTDACLYLMANYNADQLNGIVNIGTGKDCTITELAELIAEVVAYKGKIIYDTTKPDGTPRKLLDVRKLENLGWSAKTSLREGIEKTYKLYLVSSI
jgi:GDP-L-fucose synthase